MRRALPLVLALALLPLAASTAGGTPDPCGKGLRVSAHADDRAVCTHGADVLGLPLPTDDPSAPPAPCLTDGVSGNRVQVLYGVPADRPNDYANKVATIRTAVDNADWYFETSDAGTSQHLRWLCSNGQVSVDSVTLVPVGADGLFTFDDLVASLTPRSGKGKKAAPVVSYRDPTRVYVVFVDGIDDGSYPYCGQGGVDADDSPGATNRNNSGPAYSLIACWNGSTALHEIGHNLGAVQLSAPHSSGAYHCYDESDVMCYDDGGSWYLGPDGTAGTADDRSTQTACAPGLLAAQPTEDRQFDCNEDDYYDPSPAPGSYLDTHWNLARSAWVSG